MTNILIIEDEESIRESLAFLLDREGFAVDLADNGQLGLEKFESGKADLILLDLMLPELSGTDICRHIRSKSNVPIIMLTAKDSEIDKVVGLELGADDYVTKPFSTPELIARIKAVLRGRSGIVAHEIDGIKIGRVQLDHERHEVRVGGKIVSMPLKEFELLNYLMENAGFVLSRGQIMDRIWGSTYVGDGKTLDVHIKRIREKIEEDPSHPKLLSTIRGLGYRFESS